MRYLLDTCTLLWLAEGNTQMSQTARNIVADQDNEGAASTVSFWELSMKSVVGKLFLPMPPADLGRFAVQENLTILPLSVEQIDRFYRLPVSHRDAFDRMIAAVALTDGYVVLSPDTVFETFGVARLW